MLGDSWPVTGLRGAGAFKWWGQGSITLSGDFCPLRVSGCLGLPEILLPHSAEVTGLTPVPGSVFN